MEPTPSISVALASYNGIRYIDEQIESILAQTLPVSEIVICDDGSNDGTRERLKEWAQRESQIVLQFNEERLGFRNNFFLAITLCRSPLIALADQDDIWLPDKLERLLPYLQTADLACSDLTAIDARGEVIAHSVAEYENRRIEKNPPFTTLLYTNVVTGCTALFKKELLTDLPYDGERYHDWWLALLASRRGGIAYLDAPTVLYRQHGENDTGIRRSLLFRDSLRSFSNRILRDRKKSKRYSDAEQQRSRLKGLLAHTIFNEREKREIARALDYYQNYLQSPLHLNTFWIGLRYRREVHGKLSLAQHLSRTLSDLIG